MASHNKVESIYDHNLAILDRIILELESEPTPWIISCVNRDLETFAKLRVNQKWPIPYTRWYPITDSRCEQNKAFFALLQHADNILAQKIPK